MDARTKIVATLGPASEHPDVLDALLLAGVDVVRLNLSHGTLDDHLVRLAAVRAAGERVGQVVAVLADLPGPKVRAGQLPDGVTRLVVGDTVALVGGDGPSTAHVLRVDYPTLVEDVRCGDRVVLGDGAITLVVEHIGESGVEARVLAGGQVQGRPGVHLPSERLRMSAPTAQDLEMAKVMVAHDIDFLGVSFVRSAADLRQLRDAVGPATTRLVAKIETLQAVAALDEITAEADAVMVARGDLGIECPLEDVPHLQKRIIRHCVEVGVPVITATQMMESMIAAPSPTRAEVSDVANAVFDGTDALMLSGETAIGIDPVAVVTTMVRVAERAEQEASYVQWGRRLGRAQSDVQIGGPDRITMAITHAAGLAAVEAGAAALLCCTRSGRTAQAMARFRPTLPLLGLSPDPATVRALALSWGVTPLHIVRYESTDELVWFAVETAVLGGHLHGGDVVLVLAGAPDRPSEASTDVLRIVTVS